MKVPEQKYDLLPFNAVSFKYPFKEGISQEEGKEVIRKHMFMGKHLVNTPMEDYPQGFTKQAVVDMWVQKNKDGLMIVQRVPYSAMFLRGMTISLFYLFLYI
jgi:hypothetical protein